MVLAALLFIRRVAETTTVAAVTNEYIKDSLHHSLHRLNIPPYMQVFRIHGPFLFGATDKLNVVTDNIDSLPEIVVLRLRNMNAIDGTGLLAFEELADRLHESGRELLLCGARRQPAHLMERADFHRHVGDENICQNIGDAIARAEALHAERAAPVDRGTTRGQRMNRPSLELQTLKAEFFRALAHPARIRLLEVLSARRRAGCAGAAGAARSGSADRVAAARAAARERHRRLPEERDVGAVCAGRSANRRPAERGQGDSQSPPDQPSHAAPRAAPSALNAASRDGYDCC